MNTLINYIQFFFLIHFFYIKTAGKRDSSKSRYACTVDEIFHKDRFSNFGNFINKRCKGFFENNALKVIFYA